MAGFYEREKEIQQRRLNFDPYRFDPNPPSTMVLTQPTLKSRGVDSGAAQSMNFRLKTSGRR